MRLDAVRVSPGHIDAVLAFAASEPLRTSEVPALASALVDTLPGLRTHRCENPTAASFAVELTDTEIAHAVEHVALEVMALAGSPDTLRGATTWDFAASGPGVFALRIQYDDRAVALGALSCAVDLVDALCAGAPAPDPVATASRLRGARL